MGPQRRLGIYVGFLSASIIHYLEPLTRNLFTAHFADCHFDESVFPPLMSLKVIHFQSIFLINFYLKRLIYVQKYGITHQTAIQQGIQEKNEFLQ